jgi:hypothetical protein
VKGHPVHIVLLIFFIFGLSSRFFLTAPQLLDPSGVSERLITSTTIKEIISCAQGNVISLDDPEEAKENIANDVSLALALYVLIKAETDSVVMPASLVKAEGIWFSGDTEWSPPQPSSGDGTAFVKIIGGPQRDTRCLAGKFSVRIGEVGGT